MMNLYNTLSKKVEKFEPLNNEMVNFFVCGPTVYDYSHIGHAKTYVQMDIIARVIKMNGYKLNYLQNITDIDDKIINRSNESNIGWKDLSLKFEQEYKNDMVKLGNTSVDTYARATDHIDNIINQVRVLLDKNNAYIIDGDGVYFEISTFKEYGKLSGRKEINEDDAQTRIDQSDKKRGWNDFCLWKFSKPGEPVWDAPFGEGRPGWHIEDTAITEHFFGPQYDIHGGAEDLIFPHHEAELTQMESISGKIPFVKYWTHVAFLKIDGNRMGKSKGNFITIQEILNKGYNPMAIRMLMIQSHYRSPINFSWDSLEEANSRLKSIQETADLRFQINTSEANNAEFIQQTKEDIKNSLSNDINTPQALAAISGLQKVLEDSGISKNDEKIFLEFLKFLDDTLGLNLLSSSDIDDNLKQLISEREQARNSKNWAKSDEIRDQLAKESIVIRDTRNGTVWARS